MSEQDPAPPTTPASTPPAAAVINRRLSVPALIAVAMIGCAGVLLILYAWRLPPFATDVQRTDNAYVRGQVTLISPKLDGYILAVHVQDFMPVRAGDVIAEIDPRIFQQKLDQARATLEVQQANLDNFDQTRRSREANIEAQRASLASARAQLQRAQADMRRADELVADGSLSTRELDQTAAALHQAEAAVQQAHAALQVAYQDLKSTEVGRSGLTAAVDNARAAVQLGEIDIQNTRITAPQDGRLGEVSVRVGQYVTPGTQLTYLVPPTLWVIANFKEAQTAGMRPGQKVRILVDALGGATVWGTVERLSPATGSEFSVLKPDNATGNFVKIAQRIPVRITVDAGQKLAERLAPGMSVVVHVDTGADPVADRAVPAISEPSP
jgi:multidrug resistance efflux pump